MLTTRNSDTRILWFLTVLGVVVLLSGCTPSGPKALLQGERLIHEGRYADAIERLKIAVQLLPDNGQAWNHLGIAFHSAGQMNEASSAYRQALRRNANLTVAHFNLGVLALEQNNPQAAVSELSTYTVLQRDSSEGWLKLGTAQLRARQLDGAEKSFQSALRLKPGLAEALNGLGIVNAQRRQVREAVAFFSNALKAQPNYAPALLNLGVVTQAFDRSAAVQHYRIYLALYPAAPNAAAVRDVIQQIESESAAAPPPSPTSRIASVGQQLAPTNITTLRAANLPPPSTAQPSNAQPIAVMRNIPSPTNTLTTGVVAVARARLPSLKGAEQLALGQPSPKPNGPLVHAPAPPPPRGTLTRRPQEGSATNDPAPTPAFDAAPLPQKTPGESRALSRSIDPDGDARRNNVASPDAIRTTAPEEKPSFGQRLNPTTWFRAKNRPAPITTPLDPSPRLRSTPLPQSTAPPKEKLLAQSESGMPAKASSEPKRRPDLPPPLQEQPATPRFPRYPYFSPAKPATGDRVRAEQALARGVLAHGQRELSLALNAYREAVRLDPSLFEAQYDLGLAAYELKDWPLSLSSYEAALSINPTSTNARFNFALALDRAGYSLDSVAELEKILTEHPKESRAHFSVAKIYAEDLKQTDSAARHYRQFLELEPQHPQAAAIRQWLVAHAASY